MNTTILLIGPSGVGKSTASEILESQYGIKVYDLDKVLKEKIGGASLSSHLGQIGDSKFFDFSKDAIESLSSQAKSDILIVIGAGSINYPLSHKWYSNQNLIALKGSPEVIYDRGERQVHHPQLESFVRTEYNTDRLKLYESAKETIDVTHLSPQEVADELLNKIKHYLQQPLKSNA